MRAFGEMSSMAGDAHFCYGVVAESLLRFGWSLRAAGWACCTSTSRRRQPNGIAV